MMAARAIFDEQTAVRRNRFTGHTQHTTEGMARERGERRRERERKLKNTHSRERGKETTVRLPIHHIKMAHSGIAKQFLRYFR